MPHMRRVSLITLLACFAVPTVHPTEPTSSLPPGLYAEFATPRGTVICELFFEKTPLTVANFVGLAEGSLAPRDGKPFFTGLTWYRVVPGFVIQSGNPGLKDTGDVPVPYTFNDEFVPGLHNREIGTLSMANAGPDTNGCEFFVTRSEERRVG